MTLVSVVVSSCGSSRPVAPVSRSICRLWLQWWLSSPHPVAPVSISCRPWLQCSLLLFMAPVSVVVHGSTSICWSLVAPVSSVVCGSSSSISCRSWLRYLLSLACCGSGICCRSWLQYLVSSHRWLQYLLSFLAPVSPVVRGSSISCRSWLQYLLLVAPFNIACLWL